MSERSTDEAEPDSAGARAAGRLGRRLRRKPSAPPPPPRHAAPPPGSRANGTAPTSTRDGTPNGTTPPDDPHPESAAPQRPRPRPRPAGAQVRSAPERSDAAADTPATTAAGDAAAAPRPRPRPGRDTADTNTDTAKTDNVKTDNAETDTAASKLSKDTPAETETAAVTSTAAAATDTADSDDASEEPTKQRRSFRFRLRRTPWTRRITKLVIVVAVIVAAALLLRTYVVAPYYIPSASMEPTLHGCPGCDDDHVLVDKFSYRFHHPHTGDIVVFDKPPGLVTPDSVLIKRVVATGGEKVVLRNGFVYVNGSRLREPYINKACGAHPTRPLTNRRSWLVPDNDLFVMGDNRCDSEDSRMFGPITDSSVVGRAFVIVYPFKDFDFL